MRTVGGAVTPLYFSEHILKGPTGSGLIAVYDINPHQLRHLEGMCRTLFMGDSDDTVCEIGDILRAMERQAV